MRFDSELIWLYFFFNFLFLGDNNNINRLYLHAGDVTHIVHLFYIGFILVLKGFRYGNKMCSCYDIVRLYVPENMRNIVEMSGYYSRLSFKIDTTRTVVKSFFASVVNAGKMSTRRSRTEICSVCEQNRYVDVFILCCMHRHHTLTHNCR